LLPRAARQIAGLDSDSGCGRDKAPRACGKLSRFYDWAAIKPAQRSSAVENDQRV
jgi:hypothetical protein